MAYLNSLLCLTILLLGNICLAQNVCTGLNIGSAVTSSQFYNDIVKDGVTNERWLPHSNSPVLASPHKVLDYFYVNNLTNLSSKLELSNIELKYDLTEQADSSILVREDKEGWYVIEINYECRAYGGYLISYEINVTIPECGSTTFVWKKLCGNPFTERTGLTVEATYGDAKKILVKNGKLHRSGLTYDKEVDNYALRLPLSVNAVKLDIYLNEKDMKDNKGWSLLSSIPQQSFENATDLVVIDRILADSDQNVLGLVLTGELSRQAGTISKTQRQQVEMLLTCNQQKGFSTIEVDINIPNFRDIDLFLVKECADGAFDSGNRGFWIFVAIVCVYGLIFYLSDNKKAFPFQERLKNLYYRIRRIRIPRESSSNGNELKSLQGTREDDELEFRNQHIKDAKKEVLDVSKYGTF